MRVLRIRHLTIAVRDVDAAREAFASLFGAEASDAIEIAAFGARTQDVSLGESRLQLVSPRDPQGALQRFIERRGEGVYTVALDVDNLEAAVAELAAKGVRVSEPVESAPGVRTAFVTMSATHGVSIQLVQAEAAAEEAASPWTTPTEAQLAGTAPPEPTELEPKKELDLTPDEWSDLD
jgi:methylmalonyl-CoA epimerase